MDPGYTFDGVSNPNYIKDGNERMRYDRVMVRGIKPKSIKIVGTDDICLPHLDSNGMEMKIKISDHYGLLTEIEL